MSHTAFVATKLTLFHGMLLIHVGAAEPLCRMQRKQNARTMEAETVLARATLHDIMSKYLVGSSNLSPMPLATYNCRRIKRNYVAACCCMCCRAFSQLRTEAAWTSKAGTGSSPPEVSQALVSTSPAETLRLYVSTLLLRGHLSITPKLK